VAITQRNRITHDISIEAQTCLLRPLTAKGRLWLSQNAVATDMLSSASSSRVERWRLDQMIRAMIRVMQRDGLAVETVGA
jgi:hypothetical protein